MALTYEYVKRFLRDLLSQSVTLQCYSFVPPWEYINIGARIVLLLMVPKYQVNSVRYILLNYI